MTFDHFWEQRGARVINVGVYSIDMTFKLRDWVKSPKRFLFYVKT